LTICYGKSKIAEIFFKIIIENQLNLTFSPGLVQCFSTFFYPQNPYLIKKNISEALSMFKKKYLNQRLYSGWFTA
jgi:hypothetical protein